MSTTTFPDKETIFRSLLDRYFLLMSQPQFPFNRAPLRRPRSPKISKNLGLAARDMVREYREYVAPHLRRRRRVRRRATSDSFYEDMAVRFDSFFQEARHGRGAPIQTRQRPLPPSPP